ncbi:sensor histidine kinase, partial [Listeria grayi FSL F6-1183]
MNKAGQEVGSYKKPKKVPTAYAPIDIVQQYKYKEVDAQTTTYFGQKGSLTYMVGVADS